MKNTCHTESATAPAVTDITPGLEAALLESDERFQILANSIPHLAWMAQADGYVVWYNRRWYEYTGTTPQQMAGWGWQGVHDPLVLPTVMAEWQGSIATGQPFDMEFPLRGADGRFRIFLTRVVPLKDAEGRVVQWFGTNTDLSQRLAAEEENRRLEAALGRRTMELLASIKEGEAFAHSVYHDLRTPLRSIDGFSQALLEDYGDKLDAKAQDQLARIRSAAQRMARLIDGLLGLSRVSRPEVDRQLVNLSALARTVATQLQASERNREVEFVIAEEVWSDGDVELLGVAMDNLLSNAWKFTAKQRHAVIEFGATDHEGKTTYFVRDNGAGFDMSFADRLFGVFKRLHKTSEFPGTGVGLATVQRIVQRHGGRVWAQGEVDKGATFYFTLTDGESNR